MAPISKVSNLFIKILLVALIASLLLHPSLVDATDLRGRVEGKHAYSSNVFAASNVSVALYIQTGSGWKHMAATNTGPNGTYFIPNVRPGNYF